ncbi:hypothetical protein ACFOZ5_01865 [Marinobacter lacisalsi]|uniref:Carboxymuconolactone decarboxylase-like domain-containing protein n=1 Tax=Marinobacter lacisalsi TaxID=475979 RepID=A0ABV8QBP7_9GAMM
MIRALASKRLDAAERELGESHDYMRHILNTSLRAFLRFAKIFPISDYRRGLPADAYHVARIVAARDEDCGTCVQVEVNLGVRDNVAPEILQAVIDRRPDQLPANLQIVYEFVGALVGKTGNDEELRQAIRRDYGEEGLVELALAIGASRFLPSVKRTLGYGKACSLVEVRLPEHR